jgi:hypothetical protein
MNAAVFAYVLVLRGKKYENELMALLSEERRTEVQAVLENVKAMSPAEIRLQLKQLRDDQINRQRESARSRIGFQLDRVSPKLSAWLTRPF